VLGLQYTHGMCGACGRGWESRGVPPLPVISPCSKLDFVLGTGALFDVGFMSVSEAGIIAGTGSGGSWGTSCGELHPPAQGLPKQHTGWCIPWGAVGPIP